MVICLNGWGYLIEKHAAVWMADVIPLKETEVAQTARQVCYLFGKIVFSCLNGCCYLFKKIFIHLNNGDQSCVLKKSSSFRTVKATCFQKWSSIWTGKAICSKKLVIHWSGWGYPFKKMQLFKQLMLSVWKKLQWLEQLMKIAFSC